jgi:subtilisin-like proprotein convertase family protein
VLTPLTGDGVEDLEPGEAMNLALPVRNVGDGTATGVNVTVVSDDARAVVAPRVRSYGNVAAGATRSRDFRLTLAPDYPRGKRFSLAVRVTFAGRLSPTTASFPVTTGEPAAEPTVFVYTGAPVPIPDDSDDGVSVTIPVDGIGYASNLRFSIDGTTCTTTAGATTVGLDHTFVGDLVGTLTSPVGHTVTLMDRDGSGGNNLCQVVFDDAATRSFATATTANNPFTGSWRPNAGRLEEFLLEPVDGDWTFRVADVVSRDTGTLRAVSLHINGFVE